MTATVPATSTVVMSNGLVPITVAVTGHRDIPKEDVPKLTAALRKHLDCIAKDQPNSPLLFLSGLAEGADRLAARCALDAGWQFGAVLPLPQSDYEADFETPESIAEFRGLLGQAAWVQVVGRPDQQIRPICYATLGHWLSRYALLLVAFWDGEASRLEGGTAETVREFLEGIPRDDVSLPESGPVRQIATRRLRAMDSQVEVGKVTVHPPRPGGLASEGEMGRWEKVLRRIDDFNRDAKAALQARPKDVVVARTSLFDKNTFDDAGCATAARNASWLHAVADQISFGAQTHRKQHLQVILWLSLMAIVFQQIYGGPLPQPFLLLVAVVCGGLAYGVFRHGQHLELEARYLDYRALAEAARTQFYWKLAGIDDCAADHFLREQRGELEWVRQAVLISELGGTSSVVPSVEQMTNIRSWWVEDQRSWLLGSKEKPGGKLHANESLSRKWATLANGFVLGGLLAVLALVPFHLWVAPQFEGGDLAASLVTAVYGILFAVGGLCKVYQEIMAFQKQANRYRSTGLAMTLARNRLDVLLADGNVELARNLFLDLGKTALAENSDWLLTHRDRPLNVPLAG